MTTAIYMTMASQAIKSAHTLLDSGDTDGACNRAYYAMFNAANAALIAKGGVPEPKSHMALLRLFSLNLIKTGALPSSLGRALHNVQTLRHVADYQLSQVDQSGAEGAISSAKSFIKAIQDYITQQEQQAGTKPIG